MSMETAEIGTFSMKQTIRSAVQRVAAPRGRHAFKAEMDDEARRAMLPQNERLPA